MSAELDEALPLARLWAEGMDDLKDYPRGGASLLVDALLGLEAEVIAEWEDVRQLDPTADVSDRDAWEYHEGRHEGYVHGLGFVLGLFGWDVPFLRQHSLRPKCEHEWVDATNDVVESGEMCVKCHAIRAGS